MATFKIGQRWISETEPELGLGRLEEVSRHQIQLAFPASNEARLYAPANAPIKRVEFHVGDTIHSQKGEVLVIEAIREDAGILTYVGGGIEVVEMDLADTISFSKPEDRLIGGQIDPSAAFNLRYEAIQRLAQAKQSQVAGFAGGRIDLIPHQLYIAAEVSNRYMPRVLLADEVGAFSMDRSMSVSSDSSHAILGRQPFFRFYKPISFRRSDGFNPRARDI